MAARARREGAVRPPRRLDLHAGRDRRRHAERRRGPGGRGRRRGVHAAGRERRSTWPRRSGSPTTTSRVIDDVRARRPRLRAVDQADAARPGRRSRSRLRQRAGDRPARRRRPATTSGWTWSSRRTSTARSTSCDRLRDEIPRIGVALQAYLHRTADDVAAMVARGIGIRLVKGAYNEPPAIAFPKKADVDANYVKLARLMLETRRAGQRLARGVRHARHDDHPGHRAARRRRRPGADRVRDPHALRHPARRAAAPGRATARTSAC